VILPPQMLGVTSVRYMKVIESTAVPTDPAGGVSNRWKYQLESINFDPQTGVVGSPTEKFVLPQATVWNVFEMSNTELVAMGITIANLPGTFVLQPVPTGTIVPAWLTMDDTNKWTGFLLWPNQFDGAC